VANNHITNRNVRRYIYSDIRMKTRKQEFKEYWAELGWGDRLEFLFKWSGIKWLVKKINPNCNCDERKEKMNEFKFKRK
jgi:hypothetical protein